MPSNTGAASLPLTFQPKKAPFGFGISKTSSKLIIRVPSLSHSLSRFTLNNVKCNSSSGEQPQAEDGKLSNILDQRVEELLGRQENKELLAKLNKASQRVEIAKQQLASIQNQQLQAQQMRLYIDQLQSKASQIAECQQEVMEARAMVEEAERYLSGKEKMTRDEERWESVKAAVIAASIGTLAAAPVYYLTVTSNSEQSLPQLLLQLGITFASCALFGVTFRYAVRTDLDNIQLKTGTPAAFAFVKGLAKLNGGPPLELNSASFFAHALDGLFFVSQDLFIFIFAAVSLDFCFKTRIVNPFPITKSDSTQKQE